MFHSYVSLPEGNLKRLFVFLYGVEGIDRDCQSMACDLQYVG